MRAPPGAVVAAIVLAAGSSSRLGRPKQLVAYQGEPLVRRTTRAALEAGCWPVLVVTGSAAGDVEGALEGTRVECVRNGSWREGVGASIACGARALETRGAVGAAVICVCDQPALTSAHLSALVARWHAGHAVVASHYAGAFGVPALFDRSVFHELRAIDAAAGAKSLLAARPLALVELRGGELDVDTPADLDALLDRSPLRPP